MPTRGAFVLFARVHRHILAKLSSLMNFAITVIVCTKGNHMPPQHSGGNVFTHTACSSILYHLSPIFAKPVAAHVHNNRGHLCTTSLNLDGSDNEHSFYNVFNERCCLNLLIHIIPLRSISLIGLT